MKFKVNGAVVEISSDPTEYQQQEMDRFVDRNADLHTEIRTARTTHKAELVERDRIIKELNKLLESKQDRLERVEMNLDRARSKNCLGCTIRDDLNVKIAKHQRIADAIIALAEFYEANRNPVNSQWSKDAALAAWKRVVDTDAAPSFRNLCNFVGKMLG